jgi:glycosyltransferase involved in cell wall biosynthesis
MNIPKPVVEVVVLSHNYGRFISAALESVLSQNQDNFQLRVTVADDCSTDETLEVVSRFLARYPGVIRILPTDRNRGSLGNTLHAFENLECDYFCLLDADDLWVGETKLTRQVEFLEQHSSYSMCAGMTLHASEDKVIGQIGTGVSRVGSFSFEDFVNGKGYFLHTSSILYRNIIYKNGIPQVYYDALGTYRECAYRGEDWRFIEHLRWGPIKVFNDIFSIYRFHAEGLWQGSSDLKRKVESLISALEFSSRLDGAAKVYFEKKFREYCAPVGSVLSEVLVSGGDRSDVKALSVLGDLLKKYSGRKVALSAEKSANVKRPLQQSLADADDAQLFDGNDSLFKSVVSRCSVYGEYGCGRSTVWVAKNSGCTVYSVDSSPEWAAKVRLECDAVGNAHVHLADVGPVGSWGTPLGYQKHENFREYTDWIWSRGESPDVVLVDGRFRVCCFLTCLIYGAPGSNIIFDDYVDRPQYHFVERFLKPVETFGRQALFVIPEKDDLNIEGISDAINCFRFVFD